MAKQKNLQLEKNSIEFSNAARTLVHTLMAHESYFQKLDLPRNIREALEKATALREQFLATPFYVEE